MRSCIIDVLKSKLLSCNFFFTSFKLMKKVLKIAIAFGLLYNVLYLYTPFFVLCYVTRSLVASWLTIHLLNQLLLISMYAQFVCISTISIYMVYLTSIVIVFFIFAASRTLLIHRARSFEDVSGNPLVKVVLNSLP